MFVSLISLPSADIPIHAFFTLLNDLNNELILPVFIDFTGFPHT